jgi:hypothetical protein
MNDLKLTKAIFRIKKNQYYINENFSGTKADETKNRAQSIAV